MNLSSEKNEAIQSSEFQENLEMLRQTYFFSSLPMEALKVFAYMGTRETYKQGEYLFRQGDDDGQAFYILSGKASLVHMDKGSEQMLRNYDAGEFLGGFVLLSKMPRLFSLRASTEVTCLIMSREKFSSTVQQFPDLMPRFVRSVVDRIYTWEERFLSLRSEDCEICRQNIGISLV